ncbi:OprO/OprP family phosphate-selective porin, partial [bacterium]|nr:OprO/OprP family phosphate-selective porin [bacterium]
SSPLSRIIYDVTLYEKFNISGYYNYATSTSSDPKKANKVTWAVYSTYAVSPNFAIQFGRVGMPFDMAGDGSSGGATFILDAVAAGDEEAGSENAIARAAFGPGEDLGLRVDGSFNKFGYAFGVGNGQGPTNINTNAELQFAGRIWYNIFDACPSAPQYDLEYSEAPKWTLSFGAVYNDENAFDGDGVAGVNSATGETDDATVTDALLDYAISMAAGTGFRYRGLSINAEGYYRLVKVIDPVRAIVGADGGITDVGYYAMAGYFVIPKSLEIAGIMSQSFREGPDNNMFQMGVGLNWYPMKDNNIKWQTSYDYMLDYDAIAGLNDQSQHFINTQLMIQW